MSSTAFTIPGGVYPLAEWSLILPEWVEKIDGWSINVGGLNSATVADRFIGMSILLNSQTARAQIQMTQPTTAGQDWYWTISSGGSGETRATIGTGVYVTSTIGNVPLVGGDRILITIQGGASGDTLFPGVVVVP